MKFGTLIFLVLFHLLLATSAFSQLPGEEVSDHLDLAKSLSQTVDVISRLASGENKTDEALAGAQLKLQNITAETDAALRDVETQSKAINDRLAEIGPPPEKDAPPEDRLITETRANLNQVKSSLAVAKTNLEKVRTDARAKIAEISVRRQNAFTEAIFKKSDETDLLSRAFASLQNQYNELIQLFSNWFRFVIETKPWQAFGSTLLSLLLALFISFNFRRLFGAYLERTAVEPDYFTRVFTAFWVSVLPSAATAIFLFAAYWLFYYFGVLSSKISQIIFALVVVVAGTVFAWNLSRAIFAPNKPNWRLVRLSDSAANKMFWLVFALYVVEAADYLIQTMNEVLSGTVQVTALQGLIASALIGGIFILMALIQPSSKIFGSPDRVHWPRWFSLPLILIGAAIIFSAFTGYIGLARFISQQVVVTGGIITLMIMGIMAAREMSREGVLPETSFGKFLTTRLGLETLSVEQVSLATSLSIIIGVFIVGIPAILMQWGTRFEEIWEFTKRAFTGIDIGNIRLSLSGILFGLLVFAFGIFITRIIQRWLTRSVFPRSRADIGVRDSIKSGFGYIGYGLAGLFALLSAGVDLSSLAIVAGALSLGIGFGLQNVVSNFVSGLILLVERPIKTGDWIVVGSAEGTVKRISVRATEIETFQRQSIIIPNSELINSQVGNWTLKSKMGRVDIAVGVAYGSDARLVEKLLYEIAESHQMVAKKPEPNVLFANFGDSSLDFVLRLYLYDVSNTPTVHTEVRFEILRLFEEHGIEIPFPQRDINVKYMENGDKKPEKKAPASKRKASAQTASKSSQSASRG